MTISYQSVLSRERLLDGGIQDSRLSSVKFRLVPGARGTTASDIVVFRDIGVGLPTGTRFQDRPLGRQEAHWDGAAALAPTIRGARGKVGASAPGRWGPLPLVFCEATSLRR
jgi:hypothetical protein